MSGDPVSVKDMYEVAPLEKHVCILIKEKNYE